MLFQKYRVHLHTFGEKKEKNKGKENKKEEYLLHLPASARFCIIKISYIATTA